MPTPEECADAWNEKHDVGAIVRYDPDGSVPPILTQTRSEATVLSGHTAVVLIQGEAGAVALTHITFVGPPHTRVLEDTDE